MYPQSLQKIRGEELSGMWGFRSLDEAGSSRMVAASRPDPMEPLSPSPEDQYLHIPRGISLRISKGPRSMQSHRIIQLSLSPCMCRSK